MGLTSLINIQKPKQAAIGGVSKLYLLRYQDALPLIEGVDLLHLNRHLVKGI